MDFDNKQENPMNQIKAVADYFNVSVDYLVYGKEEKKKELFEEFEEEINAGTFEVVLRRVRK
jgi:hypothetical protein